MDLQISTFIDLDTKVPRGAQIRYQVDFENVEQDVANNVQLIFLIPVTTSFVSSDNAVCKFNASQSRLECNWVSIDGTDVLDKRKRVQFTIKTSKDTAQTIASEVSVSASNEDASKLQNNAETQNTSIVAGTDLKVVSLRSEPQQVYINETYTYTLNITNNGPDEATNVAVKHVLPSYATWAEASVSNSNGWSCSGSQILTCSLGKLAVSASQSLVIKAKLSQLGSGTVTATSSVSSATAEINSADNQASVSNQVKEHADVAVELKALKSNGTPSYWGPLSLTPNEAHQYQIVVKNNGPNTVSSARFVLTLAAGISDVAVAQASGWSCSVNMAGAQPKITCDKTAVASGVSDTLKVTAKAPNTEATYTNNALVSANLTDRNQANNTASAQIKTVKSTAAKMILIKSISSAKSAYYANDTLTFLLTARNASAQTLTVKTLTDALPDSVDFVSYSSTAFNCNYQAAGSQVVCTPNTAQLTANNSISATIVAKVKASVSNASVTNRANIVFDSNDSSNESVAASAVFKTVGAQPALSVTKSSNLQWDNKNYMGKRFEFKIKVTNSGGAKAVGVEVSDTLLNGYKAESVTVIKSNNSDSWTCPQQGPDEVKCIGDISVSSNAEVVITARSPYTTERPRNIAVVKHSALATDLTATYEGWGNAPVNPMTLTISKHKFASTTKNTSLVSRGENISSAITVTVSNDADKPTQGTLKVVDVLASGESFVATGSYGENWHCSHSGEGLGGTVTCLYQKSSSGSWQGIPVTKASPPSLLTITTNAKQLGNLKNTATVTDHNGLPGSAQQSATIRSAVSADLKVTKTANLSQLSAAQSELSYQIVVENVSGDTVIGDGLSALLIKDTFAGTFKAKKGKVETGIRFAASASSQLGATFSCARSDAGQYQDTVSTITCRLGNSQQFKVGDKLILTMQVSRPVITVNGNLNNLVEVSSSTHVDTDTSNNKSNVSVPVVPKFDVGITLASYATAPILSGDEALLTLEVSNMSATTATDVVLKHTFTPPSGRTFQFISSVFSRAGQANICTFNASNVLSCPIGTLTGNEVQTVTIKLRPKSYHDRKSWILASTSNITAANIDNDINIDNNTKVTSLQVNVRNANLKIENNDVTDPVAWYPAPRAFPGSLDNVLVYKVDLEYLFDNTGDLSVASGVGYDFTMTPSGADKQLQFLCDGSAKTGCTVAQARCNSINTLISSAHTITCKGPENSGNDLAEFELRENRYGSEDNIYTRYLYFKVLSRPKTTGEVSATTARIFSNENDPITANNSEAEQTSIRVAVDLSLIKRASLSKVAVGSVFNYFLDVGNAGPGDAADNIIYDYLSHDLELAGTPSIAGGRCVTDQAIKSGESSAKTRVRCTVDTIAKGQSLTATIPVKLKSLPSGSTLYNDAWIETKGFDVNSSNNRDDLTLPLSKGNISGQVFFDANNDGVLQAATDPGISGITIELSGTESTGKNIGPLLKNTGTSGEFVFEDLSAGTYQLKQSKQSQLSGYQDGFDSRNNSVISGSNNSDVISNITLTANQSSSGNLFAETLLAGDASVEGSVFVDGNQNGVKESQDLAIPSLAVTLTGNDKFGNSVSLSTNTDSNGVFKFDALRQPDVDGYVVTRADTPSYEDGQDYLDGIKNTHAGKDVVKVATVGKPSKVIFTELPNVGEARVEGAVFVDGNQNGVKESQDLAIISLAVTLTGKDKFGNAVSLSTNTDSNGAFSFTALRQPDADGYVVTRSDTPNYEDGQDYLDGIKNIHAGKDVVKITTVGKPSKVIFTELPNAGEARVEGAVFVDGNQNGVKESQDLAIISLAVTLSGKDEFGNAVSLTTNTDSNGAFKFDALRQPDVDGYVVTRADTPSYEDGQDYLDGIKNTHAGKNAVKVATVGKPSKVIFTELPNAGEARVEGAVFVDGNQNGVKESQDLAIISLAVTLSGKDEFGNAVSLTTNTDSNGAFKFDALRQPDVDGYVVTRADTPSYEDGQDYLDGIKNTHAGKNAVKVATVGKPSKVIFTELPNAGEARVEGTVFVDGNQNGVKESQDLAIPSLAVTLSGKDEFGNAVSLTTNTDSNGAFKFDALRQPDVDGYVVTRADTPSYEDGQDYLDGIKNTYSGKNAVKVATVGKPSKVIFTEQPNVGDARVEGSIFVDGNQNGVKESKDLAIINLAVTLSGKDEFGNAVSLTTNTDSNGAFKFDALRQPDADGYVVTRADTPSYEDGQDYLDGVKNAYAGKNAVKVATVGKPSTVIFTELPNAGEARVEGTVFVDGNQNGVKESQDLAIPNLAVTLNGKDEFGNSVSLTTNTDSNGAFSFTALRQPDADGYVVMRGDTPSYEDGQDYLDGIKNTYAGKNAVKVATVGKPSTVIFTELPNAGEARVEGTVFVDGNQNGVKESQDLAIPNLAVTLNGKDKFGNAVSLSTNTDSNGAFSFMALRQPNADGYVVTRADTPSYEDGQDYLDGIKNTHAGKNAVKVATVGKPSKVIFTELPNAGEARVEGAVFVDGNQNGIKEGKDLAITNLAVTLSGKDKFGNSVSLSTNTDSNGVFKFDALRQPDVDGYVVTRADTPSYEDGQDYLDGVKNTHAGRNAVKVATVGKPSKVIFTELADMGEARVEGAVFVDGNQNLRRCANPMPTGMW
ncbi:hypothetical protein PAUR_a3382 [Pseudoalteromonas aurantia 208]|uniref:DUF11 domain-containing protein n=1 Tax=Pseudoalteromonas aurantia 208 TaxID=1314867 RepID=A0ABR9E6E7_9GAMM|nr:hypothetical protein [Pseudoalteromonas aurantia 208]